MPQLSAVIEDNQRNTVMGWALCVVLALVAIENALADPLWTGFAVAGLVVALVPAAAYRDLSVLPPWEVLVLVVLPVGAAVVDAPAVLGEIATALAVVALAALCVVELHVFSPVEMTPRVAAVLVVLGTMAAAGLWTIFQWTADTVLGTTYLTTISGVMWNLVIVTVVAILGGPLFALYVRAHASAGFEGFDPERNA